MHMVTAASSILNRVSVLLMPEYFLNLLNLWLTYDDIFYEHIHIINNESSLDFNYVSGGY